MGLFDSIVNAITGKAKADPEPPAEAKPLTEATAAAAATTLSSVDLSKTLAALAEGKGGNLDWQLSIVDLLKTLGLDSSHKFRVELAHELGYAGDEEDSAAMNEWLHTAVMKRLAEHGGKLDLPS